MPVAHRCPMWSGGRSLPDSCCQMGPDTVEWPLALCVALALCAALSVAVRPQALLCGPRHCCAALGIAVRPLALLCGPWRCCQPLALLGGPWLLLGGPWSLLGGPWLLLGGPWLLLGGPWLLLGGPWRCLAAPGSAGQSMVPLGSPWYRWAAWIPGTAARPGDRCHCSTANLSLVTKSIPMCLFLLKY